MMPILIQETTGSISIQLHDYLQSMAQKSANVSQRRHLGTHSQKFIKALCPRGILLSEPHW